MTTTMPENIIPSCQGPAAKPLGRQYGSFRAGEVPSSDAKPIHTMVREGFTLVKLSDSQMLVEFKDGSRANPTNWTFGRQLYIAIVTLLLVLAGGISAALPSNSVAGTMREFGIEGDRNEVLPTAVFLIGYIVGPIVFSPMSETIGRKPVLLWTFVVFVLASLGASLAPDWRSFLVFRWMCGTAGSAPQTVVSGLYADMFADPRLRGRMMAFYMSATSFGPILGPIISGCAIPENWRWCYRIVTIFLGCTLIGMLFISETFGPVILKEEASRLRKESNSDMYITRHELHWTGFRNEALQIVTRPIAMLLFEPVVLFTSIYLAYAYGLLFFSFQAYPIVFQGTYGFSTQDTALAFIAVGVGASSSGFLILYYDTIYQTAKTKGKLWASRAEFQRLPTGCIGGPCLTIGLFWLGWSAQPHIHWICPVLSGVFFGLGYQLIFIALQTYIADVYMIYSASALAATVITRSGVAAALPLAADPLYEALGVEWGTSVVGFASLACLPIPFMFLYLGPWMRKKSVFCRRLMERGLMTPMD